MVEFVVIIGDFFFAAPFAVLGKANDRFRLIVLVVLKKDTFIV